MLLAAPPHLTSQDLLILVTKGGQVRAVVGSRPAAPEYPTGPGPRRSPTGRTPRTQHLRICHRRETHSAQPGAAGTTK